MRNKKNVANVFNKFFVNIILNINVTNKRNFFSKKRHF